MLMLLEVTERPFLGDDSSPSTTEQCVAIGPPRNSGSDCNKFSRLYVTFSDTLAQSASRNGRSSRMARTTLALKTLRARPKNQKDAGGIEDVGGAHLFAHLGAFAASIAQTGIRDDSKGRYLRIEEVIPRGRSMTIVTRSGYYGEAGLTYDTTTGKITHKNKKDEALTLVTRTSFYAPPGAKLCVAALEYKPGALHGGVLIDAFRRSMLDQYENFFFPIETVQEKDAWSASGRLKEVSVVQHQRSLSLADSTDPNRTNEVVIGEVVHSALPPKGTHSWPAKVWDALRNRQVDAATFIGLRSTNDGADPDESVFVTIERDGQQKKFELGSDGKPSIREVLTQDGEEPLDIKDFHQSVDNIVRGFYKDLDFGWKATWLQGEAAKKWEAFRW